MTTLLRATIEAVQDARNGQSVVVVDEKGNYEAIPPSYLTDGSYTGSRDVVIDLSNGLDDTGWDHLDEISNRDIAKLLIENR